MQRFHPGHKFSAKQRTTDVLTEDQVDFESFLLSPLLLKGLTDSGFEKPSPIQLKAIPLGRCGLDLIAQAKSGTGKTCVFSVIALENVLIENPSTQVLILAPTREIAVQIKDVITAIGCHMKGLSCQVFIGGLPLDVDKKAVKDCQIAIGSPGRIKNLIENKHLKTDSIRMFILDEADKLLEENFQEQINWIFSTLPANKQMMAFSATYPEYLASHLTKYMREPTFVRLNAADPSLQGIKQFYHVVAFHQLPHKIFQEKVEQLLKLLSRVNFHQCLLFSNYQIRAQGLSSTLCSKGWPATFISGSLTQEKRLQALEKLKSFKCRILISTDLTARGIDAENVNLVVNMDVPRDGETYLHRIGRAGRFGTKGVAVTFVAKGKEQERFREVEKSIGITMEALPDHIPDSLMFCNSLPDGSQQQVKHDTVEVSVLHKITTQSSKDEDVSRIRMTSVGESYASTGKKESKDHKQKDAELRTTHNNCRESVLQENRNLPSQNTNSNGSGTVLYPNNLNKLPEGLDAKQCIKCFLKENNLATTDRQGNTLELPSLEEFETDFEEFLAFTNTFKNIGLQENDSCNCTQGNRKTKEKCTLSKKYDMLSDQVGDEDKFAITVAGNIDEIGPAVVCRDVTADKDGHDHGEDTNDGRIISNGSNIDDNDIGDDDDENGVDDDGGSDKSDGRIIGDSSHDDNGSDVGESNSDADDGIDDGIDDDCDDDDRIDRIDGKVISDGSHDDNGSDVGESNSDADDGIDDDDDDDDYDRIDRIDSKVISDGSHDDNGSDVGESNSDADDGIDDDYDRIDSKVISDGSHDNGGSVGKSSSDAADVSFDNGNSDERKKVRKKENLRKVQSHSLNVIFKRKKDKNYNDMEKNPESDHQASDNSYYTDDFADPDPDPDGNSACESDSADNGDVDSYSDSHVDGDGDSGDANYNYANIEEINDNKGNAHYIDDDNDTANDYNIKDSDESELQYECSAYSNNEILYRKKGLYGPGRYYGTSQDSQSNPRTKLKTFAHYHHNKSTAPDYQWKTKYPDAPSHQNSMDHDSGLFPWQHAMHCNPNLMAFQTTSGLFHHSTGIHGYGSAHPANQHMINGTGGIQPATNKHHYARGYLPMNDAAVVQSREMPWRSVWHNAFYKINDAIQQFASLNSHPYYPSN